MKWQSQHYTIKLIRDLRQVVTPVSSTNKSDRHDLTEILLKVALTNNHNAHQFRRKYLLVVESQSVCTHTNEQIHFINSDKQFSGNTIKHDRHSVITSTL